MERIVNRAEDERHAETEGSNRIMNRVVYGTLMWPEVLCSEYKGWSGA
jgi:hypothetical protein